MQRFIATPSSPVRNQTSYRVIYGDTDKMGVVYYANYLRWFERGRSEFLRELGVPYGEIEARGVHFPVVEATCRYARPARYEDLIEIETRLDFVSRASLVFCYRVLRDGEDAPLAATALASVKARRTPQSTNPDAVTAALAECRAWIQSVP